MDLKTFLGSKYDSNTFETFVKERFYGLEIYDNAHTGDFLSESEKKSIDSYRFLGKAELDDGKEIGFFEFRSTSTHIENKRVGYNAILKKLAYDEYLDGAIASFYHPDGSVWRLSFVGFEYDEGKAKVTNLKRFTYVLGEGIPTKTPLAQLKNLKYPNLNEIEEAFSVEAVTDEFYKSYKALFEEINEELEPQKALFTGKEDPEVEIRKFSRKLLGRITFMYFLQKKGWLGVKQEWGDGDRNFLQKTLESCKGNFYDERLTPLFFTALNSMREDDYFELLDCRIPFLNGGLFTKESYDKEEITLSNELFEKIFETFNQYNFTIIEDLPHDSEVAIDPEMLGRVFENLIEENYRKGKGAFYTPREIVHYMCKQSIIMYLSNHFEQVHIENLVNDEVTDDTYIKKHATDIKERLLLMKVLDPAIGSGAFPMGILHEMVQIIGNLNKAENTSKEKKLIIENSIYGVDIDGSAVDIAKLRFWLSIIVDEEEPFPLPNLAFKIMQGNSLIETIDGFSPIPEDIYEQKESKPVSLFEDAEQSLFDESKFELLKQNIHAFYNASNTTKKKNLEQKIKAQIQEIVCGYIDIKENELNNRTKDFDAGAGVKKKEKLLNEIGSLQNSITKARKIIGDILTNNFQTTELFLYKLWFGEIIKDGGFDVIIGNPPYLRVQEIDKELSKEYKKIYDSSTGSYDLYVIFTEKGLSLLNDTGILNYIMPHLWTNSAYGKGLRKVVKNNINKLISFGAYQVFNASTYTSLVWISKASKSTLYFNELKHDINTNKELENYLNNLDNDDFTNISKSELSEEAWILTDKETYQVLRCLKQSPRKVEDIFERIFQGLKTSADNIYILHDCIEEEKILKGYSDYLEQEVIIEKGLVKPVLKGNAIHRYETLKTDKYVIFPYRIYKESTKEKADLFTENEIKSNFPYGYKYLKLCENELRQRQKSKLLNDEYWFRYIFPKNLVLFEKHKIMLGEVSHGGSFTVDTNGIYHVGQYSMLKYPHIEESDKFYITILNSKTCWFFMKNTASVLSGGYYTYRPNYLNLFPMPEIENIGMIKPFEIIADFVIWLKANQKSIDDYVDNAHIAKLFEDVIDTMVLELYFGEEMKEAGFDFIAHATELFKPIENLSDLQTKDIINNVYQSLREKDNPIRNDLQLLPIRVPMVAPILESI